MAVLYADNDMVIELAGEGKLVDRNGDAVSGATVEATLYESDGKSEVGGVTWPIVLSDDGSGEYSGILDDSAEIYADRRYVLKIIATADEGDAQWEERISAQKRGFA